MASPFDAFEAADRQFAEMQSQMDRDMDAAFREMDRSIDRSLREVQQIQRQVDEEAARLAREAAQQPGVRFERAEQRSYNSYSYYESIEIRSVPMTALVPSMAPAPSPGIAGPLLIAALALGATWAGITALFARNYNLTTFSEASRGKLLLGWPYLAAASDKFRAQLGSALRGQQYKAPTDEARGGGAGGGGGGGGS
ncbi:MAG: hypothetical protein J3K34DRAFT_420240 [Monoraphidium minutum]|nr:MAG: hypothetical protein J3K34DRAFT_420240 [Monoraphidium minutum]